MKLLKLGGSVITNKSGWREANSTAIEMLAKHVAKAWKKSNRDWVMVHGAGSFGHPLVVKFGLDNGVQNAEQKLGFSKTHMSCMELSVIVSAALNAEGIPAISVPPANVLVSKSKRINSFNIKIITDFLDSGYVPLLFGDMVPDIDIGGSVCSGDQIISYLGKGADSLVIATNVDGVLDNNGDLIPNIDSSNFSAIVKHLRGPDSSSKFKKVHDVTGGMAGKIKELLQLNTPSYIVNGLKPERVEAAMLGKKTTCTIIRK